MNVAPGLQPVGLKGIATFTKPTWVGLNFSAHAGVLRECSPRLPACGQLICLIADKITSIEASIFDYLNFEYLEAEGKKF